MLVDAVQITKEGGTIQIVDSNWFVFVKVETVGIPRSLSILQCFNAIDKPTKIETNLKR